MFNLIVISAVLVPTLSDARDIVGQTYDIETIQTLKEASLNVDQLKQAKDCVNCGQNIDTVTPGHSMGKSDPHKIYEGISDATGLNRYSICFDQYNSLDPNLPGINVVTNENAIAVCGCIKDIMEDEEIPPIDAGRKTLVSKSLAGMGIINAIEDLKVEAKSIENDLNELPHEGELTCDIQGYMASQQASCDSMASPFFKQGIPAEIAEDRLQFAERPPFSMGDFISAPAYAYVATEVRTAYQEGRLSIPPENLALLDEKDIKTILVSDLHLDVPASLFSENLIFSRASIAAISILPYSAPMVDAATRAAGAGNGFAQGMAAAADFSSYITRNYLSLFDKNHPIHQQLNEFSAESTKRSENRNTRMMSNILKDIVPTMAQAKCDSLKQKFDRLCHAEQPWDIFEIAPQTFDRAYTDIHKTINLIENRIENRAIARLLQGLARPMTEANHLIACQNKSQSLQFMYDRCSEHDSAAQISRSCRMIDGAQERSCQSYQALFANDETFRSMVMQANLGITNQSSNLDQILFGGTTKASIKNNSQCLDARTPEQLVAAQASFKQLFNQYLNQDFFKHEFASNVVTVNTDTTAEEEQDLADYCAYCGFSTTTKPGSLFSSDNSSYSKVSAIESSLADQSGIFAPSGSSRTDDLVRSSSKPIEASGGSDYVPQLPGSSYIAPVANEDTISGKTTKRRSQDGEGTEEKDNRYDELMREIERLNAEFANNSSRLESNQQEIDNPETTPSRQTELSSEREQLLAKRKALEAQKLQQEQKLAEFAPSGDSNSSGDIGSEEIHGQKVSVGIGTPATSGIEGVESFGSGGSRGPASVAEESISGEIENLATASSGLALSGTNVITPDQFFNSDEDQTFTETPLYLIDPNNQEMVIVCTAQVASKTEYLREEYECKDPVSRELLEANLQLANAEKEIVPEAQEDLHASGSSEIDLKSFNEVKSIMTND